MMKLAIGKELNSNEDLNSSVSSVKSDGFISGKDPQLQIQKLQRLLVDEKKRKEQVKKQLSLEREARNSLEVEKVVLMENLLKEKVIRKNMSQEKKSKDRKYVKDSRVYKQSENELQRMELMLQSERQAVVKLFSELQTVSRQLRKKDEKLKKANAEIESLHKTCGDLKKNVETCQDIIDTERVKFQQNVAKEKENAGRWRQEKAELARDVKLLKRKYERELAKIRKENSSLVKMLSRGRKY